jgi:DNA-binding transcriptional ArsR family regulator
MTKTLRTLKLTDPRALRALAHPIRLALVGLLRMEGPLTATEAGDLLGESAASCSFHFRQLAKYGLVEEAGGGQGRQRPWRATARFTSWSDVAETREMTAAATLLSQVVVERYLDWVLRWLRTRETEPRTWQAAANLSDTFLHLTAGELVGLRKQMQKVLDPFLVRNQNPALRPPASRLTAIIQMAFPLTDEAIGKRSRTGSHA